MSSEQQNEWWQKTEVLTGVSLVGLFFIAVSPLMVSPEASAFGAPLNYFLAVIVVPLATVAAIFLLSQTQERLDRRHGVSSA